MRNRLANREWLTKSKLKKANFRNGQSGFGFNPHSPASAANTSGFLPVSLSKMPRIDVPNSRKTFCPRHFRSRLATIQELSRGGSHENPEGSYPIARPGERRTFELKPTSRHGKQRRKEPQSPPLIRSRNENLDSTANGFPSSSA